MRILERRLWGVALAALALAGCGGDHAVVGDAEAFADKACACKSADCVDDVMADMKTLVKEVGQAADDRVSKAEVEKIRAAMDRAEACVRDLAQQMAPVRQPPAVPDGKTAIAPATATATAKAPAAPATDKAPAPATRE